MLIISLIPIYSPDNSATGYGESNWNILFWRKIGLIYFFFSIYYYRINDQSDIYQY
jgi:hypothetical protein